MTNAIDVFAPEYERLAVPASTTLVFVDGVLCEDLEPVEFVRSSWPEFSWARLAYNPAAQADPERIDPERIEERFGMGRTVCLRQLYNAIPPETAIDSLPVFIGQIEGIETTLDGRNEAVEILVRDYSAALDRITVYGRHVRQDDGSTLFLSGLETTFNPKGQANGAADPVTVEGKTYRAFCVDALTAVPWDAAEAIGYLLGAYIPSGVLCWPDRDQIGSLAEHRPVRDLDVTGLSLLDALQRRCQKAGLQFQFEPHLATTGPRQAIVFYRNGQGRAVELNCQPAGGTLNLSRTNIAALHSKRRRYPVTHRHVAQGDFKVYEATFELVGAWDPTLEETDHAKFSPSTNPQFYAVKDVYRKWCLNEAGDYTVSPYNQGEPFDFSRIFEDAAYLQRRRRFWPALSTDRQGHSLGYVLEVSYDAGLHWWPYVYAFDNLLDECGLWLSSDQLDVDTWVAVLKGTLKVRLTASVVSDERLTVVAADGPVGSTAPVVDHVTTLPRQFRYRKVSRQSVLAQTDSAALGEPDEVDDSTALYEFVRGQAVEAASTVETTQVQTSALTLHLHPGDRVTSSPESRDLLQCRGDNRSLTWIERVCVDFRKQCTELKLIRQRI